MGNQLIYSLKNHKTGQSGIVCVGYSNNIVSTLDCYATKDFCYNYLAAFAVKRLRIPWVLNDYELVVNHKINTVDMYRRKIPYSVSTELDFSKFDHVATLSLQLVPSDREFHDLCVETYDKFKV